MSASIVKKARLGILLSGRGSNLRAIAEAHQQGKLPEAEIAMVISNKAAAPGLTYAQSLGIPTAAIAAKNFETLEAYDQAILALLQEESVDLLILAGYMKILSSVLLNAYPNRILNIHPSLLPAYGGIGMHGMRVHEAVIKAGEKVSGCTVHLVTEDVDNGPILGQAQVILTAGETPESLASKVLAQEHQLYPKVIQQVAQGNFQEVLTSHGT
jgi:phosphoribosylglycinamide formyltransferase 1